MAAKHTVLWGYHPVSEALRARRRKIETLYTLKEKRSLRVERLMALARRSGAALRIVDFQSLTALVGHSRHQGVGAAVSDYPCSSIDAILQAAVAEQCAAFILVLDQIVDPQNLGAIARTAHSAGLQGIILPRHGSAPPSPAASKASAGALEHMRLAYVTNLSRALEQLKSEGLWIAAADHRSPENLFDADLTGPLALVVGGEEKGIRPLVKRHCDFALCIPRSGALTSLNASAATAVIIYEAFRQRGKPSSRRKIPHHDK